MLAMLLHSLPGTPFVYQGEEIGMTNMRFPHIEDYNDPRCKKHLPPAHFGRRHAGRGLKRGADDLRDNARTPMQWNATENAGFTTGKPWLGINPNYTKIKRGKPEKRTRTPFFSCYKALIALRKSSPALSRGDLEIPETGSDTLFALKRSYNGETLLSFHNFSAEPSKIPSELVPQNGEVLLSSYDREGGYIGPNLRPYESVIFRV